MYFDGEGHVAMYVGNGMLVDAPQPGQNVEEIPITTSWYAQTFNGAARPVAQPAKSIHSARHSQPSQLSTASQHSAASTPQPRGAVRGTPGLWSGSG